MARDKIHYAVKRALEKDGWTITADPFYMRYRGLRVDIDLEASKFIELEQADRRILVEIKTFTRTSLPHDFYNAHGKYDFYKFVTEQKNMEQDVFLALSTVTYSRFAVQPAFLEYLDVRKIKVIVIDLNTETVKQWID